MLSKIATFHNIRYIHQQKIYIMEDFMTDKILRLDLVEGANLSNKYEFPTLEATFFEPNSAVPFDRIRSCKS